MTGARNGMITQQPLIAIQGVLKMKEIFNGTSMVVFSLSPLDKVFTIWACFATGFNLMTAPISGATSLKEIVPLEPLPIVLHLYKGLSILRFALALVECLFK